MKRHAWITNGNQVMIGHVLADNTLRLAWPHPLQCASAKQAEYAVDLWCRRGQVIGRLPGERKARNEQQMEIWL